MPLKIDRKPGQRVWIGDALVEVQSRSRVSLIIWAPETTPIVREELTHEHDDKRGVAAAPAVAGVLPHRPGLAVRGPDRAA